VKNRKGRHPWKLGAPKNGDGENGEDEVAAPSHADLILHSHITLTTHIYKTVTLPLRFTKMPLWASNVDPLTLLTWK